MAASGASAAEQLAGKDLSEWEAASGIQVGINATYGPWTIKTTRGPIGDKAAMEKVVETLSSPDTEVHQAHDWTFSTRYSGSASVNQPVAGHSAPSSATHQVQLDSSASGIDFAKVGDTSEPIEQADDVDLFESELDDNGQARYHVKIRCMPSRTYVLARFWLRVDKVLLRAFETRVWVEHDSSQIVREYSEREVPWGTLKAMGLLTLADSSLARREDEACTHMEKVCDTQISHISVIAA